MIFGVLPHVIYGIRWWVWLIILFIPVPPIAIWVYLKTGKIIGLEMMKISLFIGMVVLIARFVTF